jgi:hypothetical protein
MTEKVTTEDLPATRPYHALKGEEGIDEVILDMIGHGQTLQSIGEQLGVSKVAIFYRAMQHPDYKVKLRTGLELRMNEREKQLEDATDKTEIYKRDRLLNHARWLAERQLPSDFGAGQKIMGADGGQLTVEVIRFSGRTIEGESA